MTTDLSSKGVAPEARTLGRRPGRRWLNFVTRRLIRLVISLWVLVTAVFLMVRLIPGDPVIASLGDQATPQLITQRRHDLGLDLPLVEQYFTYIGHLFRGDFGTSIVSHDPVSTLLTTRLPNTLSIAIPAFVLVLLLGGSIGFAVAIYSRRQKTDRLRASFITTTGLLNSIPEFVMAIGLTAIFALWLGLFPVAGKVGFASYVLPVVALVIGHTATMARIVRVEALKVLDSDYILAIRSRRLPMWRINFRHVLPNMVTASLTYAGLLISGLIAGAVLVENVFGWPGVGSSIATAVIEKDYPVIQSILLVLGAMVLVINSIVDLVLGLLDPRTRVAES